MMLSEARAFRERGRAQARAAAAEAADRAATADSWLRALHTSADVLHAAQRAKLATALLRDLLDPDNGGGVSLIGDPAELL